MSAQQEQANVQPEDISLEEDDTFEEFEVEEPVDNQQPEEDSPLWEVDWDDEDTAKDFLKDI